MNRRSEFSRGLRTRLLAAAAGLLCTVPSLAATMDRVDKGYWLTTDYQSLSTKTASGQIVDKIAPTRSDVRFRNLHAKLPAQMRGKVLTAEGLARAHLGLLDEAGAKRATQDTLKLANVSPLRNGAQIVRFRSEVEGIEVFRGDISLLLDGNQNLRALSGVWPSVPPQALGKTLPAYRLGAEQALGHALSAYGFGASAVVAGSVRAPAEGGYINLTVSNTLRGSTDELVHSARAKKVLFPSNNRLIPAWYIETVVGPRGVPDSEYYSQVIDAENGDVLFRHNQTESEDYQYNVWAENAGFLPYPGPQGRQATPYPGVTDQGLTPPAVATELITLANVPFSTNAGAGDPWLPNGASVLTGNNTEAYTDAGTEGFTPADGDIRGTAFTAGGPVPPPYDPTLEPNASDIQRAAAVRQMFYFVNWTHDWYYDAGFDEASGNAQTNNFSRGGTGNDSIKAEGQDNSNYPGNDCFPNCSNNANMSTPADGARPRMQMFTWSPVGAASFTRLTPIPQHVSGGVGLPGWATTPFNLTDNIVQATDVAGDGDGTGTTTDGCSAFGNAGAVNGNIAFVDRGSCNFVVKVQNAFAAGASGIVIGNLVGSAAPATMGDGGTPPTPAGALNLPALLISFADAQDLRTALTNAPGAVTGTLLRAAGIRPDGTVDNQIMAHELGHYVSNRLVHNSAGLTTNHSRGLGEGWGDFHAQLMTVKSEDLAMAFGADYAGAYGMAAYSTGNYWAGIRTFPYTTNLAINDLTYGDLITRTQVHAAGEIWASSLWQCYAGILNSGLTFADAQQRMKEYLIAGYKLTPPGPFFTEARDAVLAAMIASGETADFEVCAAGFATRGAGIYAVPPNDRNGTTNAGVVEDFTIDGKITLGNFGGIDDSGASCDIDGVLDVGEEGVINLPFNNVGWLSLSDSEVQVSSDFAGLVFPDGATYAVPNTVPYQSETVQIPVRLDSAPSGTVTLTFTATDPDVGVAPAPLVVPITMNFDYVMAASDTFDTSTFDSSILGWHTQEEFGATASKKWVKRNVGGAQVAFGTNIGTGGVAWLETPAIEAGPSALSVQLSHRYSFEAGAEADGNYDGGVVEISVDGGAWAALDLPEYTNTLSACCSNPMAGRDAFTLNSAGYPAFTNLTINLSTTYNGKVVRLRFGMAEDAGTAGVGWDIDTVTVAGALNQPFPVGTGPQVEDCGTNTPPVAVDDSLTVLLGGSATVLDGGATTVQANDNDAEDDVPTGIVELVTNVAAGNSLTLNADGTFSYTDGTGADDSFTYTVQDSDGNVSNPATVTIDVNHAPTVVAALGDQTNDEGDVINISLAGVFDDSDGDTLTFSAGTLPANISVVGNALVGTLNNNSADGSPYTIDVTANDGRGGTVQDSFEWTINDTEANTPPTVVSPIANQNNVEGDTVNIDLASHFTDADGDVLSFTSDVVLPDGVTIVGGAITGTLSLVSAGGYSVTITADDSFDSGTVSAPAFTWTVAPSPTISTPANVTVAQLWVGDTAAPSFNIGNTGSAGAPDLTWTITESTDSCVTSGANSVPWFNATPAAGSTALGTPTSVTVNIDTASLTQGTNVQASLCVTSNDPAAPVRNVPVIITTLRPGHDLFARAKAITVDGDGLYADVVTSALATKNTTVAPFDPAPSCQASFGGTLWYSFSPPDDGLLTIDTLGSSGSYADTVLSIHTFNGTAFAPVACDDDGVGTLSRISDLRLNQGTTYYIQASKWNATNPTAAAVLGLNVDFHAFTGDAAMTLNPSAINTSVPSGATTFRDVAIGNANTGDRPLDWEIVDQSGGWSLTGVTASAIRPITSLATPQDTQLQAAQLDQAPTLTPEESAQAPAPQALDLGLTLSQNASNVINNSTACGANSITADPNDTHNTKWLRAFTLADYGIASDFDVTEVSFGWYGNIGAAGTTITATLYQLDGFSFTYANMTELASTTWIAPAGQPNIQMVTLPLVGTVDADQTLVLEVKHPVLTPSTARVYFGMNQSGQSGSTWLASDTGCITSSPGVPFTDPYPADLLGIANQIVMSVTGEFVCDTPTDLSWLDADTLSGSVAAGESQTVSMTLGDAVLPDGNYTASLCLVSNDPAHQIQLYPVTLDVGNEVPQITVDPASVSASVLEGGTTTQTLTIGNEGDDELEWTIAEAVSSRTPFDSELLNAERKTPEASGEAAAQRKTKLPVRDDMSKAGQAVQDGGFELGGPGTGDPANPYWNEASGAFPAFGVFCDGDCGGPTAHSGDNFLWFGGTTNATADFAEQVVTIPAAGEAMLSFWMAKTNAITGSFTVSIDGNVLATYTNEVIGAFSRVELDVLAYADDGSHTLRFDFTKSATAGNQSAFLDDVAITYTQACDFIGDVPWLDVDPTAGTAAVGGESDVLLSFDSTGLAADTYTANLCIDSNDPVNPRVTVPVSFEVVYVPPTIEVAPASVDFALESGDSDSQNVTVTNIGGGNPALDWELLSTSGALLEELTIGTVTTPAVGSAIDFVIPGGVANSGTVVGIRFEGDLTFVGTDFNYGSDTCMVVTAPTGEEFVVGGYEFSSALAPCNGIGGWDFDDGGDLGSYTSNHDNVFAPGVADAGNWTISFSNGYSGATDPITWNNVKITLVKVADVPAGCSLLDSVDWLSTTSAISGSLGAAESDVVALEADAAGLGSGTLNATLCFVSNDPATPVAQLPVSLTVAAPQLTLDPLAINLAAEVDGTDSEDLTIGNEGDADLTWSLASDEIPAPRGSRTEVDIVRASYASRGPTDSALSRTVEGGTVVTAGTRRVHVPTRGAQYDVLVLTPDSQLVPTGQGPQFIVDELNNFPDINAQLNTIPVATVTAADLASYDMVVVHNNNQWGATTPASDVAVGDALADYIDDGGKVIVFQFAYDWDAWALSGRFMTGNYGPFTVSTTDSSAPVSMVANIPSSPVLAGVSAVDYTGLHQNVGLQPGAELIASWSNGSPFVAANDNVIAINALYSISDQGTGEPVTTWTGDLDVLLHNAILELSEPLFCEAPVSVSWLSATPDNGTTIPDATSLSAITANATDLTVGTYTANLCVTSNDPANPLVVVPVTLTVSQNAAPELTAAATANYAENGTVAVLTATATDAEDAAGDLTFGLTGPDAALFVFDDGTGALSFLASPNFENPVDAGANNVYNVTLSVTDTGGLSDTQAIAITVTNVNEAPVVNDQPFQVNEGAANGSAVGTIAYSDPDAGGSHTVAATGGTGVGVFNVNPAGQISVANSAALVEGASFTLNVTVTDNGGLPDTAVITITVDSVNDAPVAGTVADVSVQFGTVVSIDAGAAFTDPDGDALTFDLSSVPGLPASLTMDANGVISGTPLEADIGSYVITVTATDPSGEDASVTFTLNVVGERIFGDGFED